MVAAGQDHCGHRGHDALAHRDHGAIERLHGVDERQSRRNAATRAVDDEGDGLGRTLMLQHQHGLNKAVADHIVDLTLQQQHTAVEQLTCHIDGGNAAVLGLLDDAGLTIHNGHGNSLLNGIGMEAKTGPHGLWLTEAVRQNMQDGIHKSARVNPLAT